MLFAVTIFISAFLLFQVQPVIARYILPWYGGSTGVWTTCILFFQVGLLLGYSYAYLLRKYLGTRQQVAVHLSLLLITLLFLPITPSEALKPVGGGDPLTGIIFLLLATVGVPYMMVSSTGPLLQHWYHQHFRDRSPYRLYALSNVGSLLALVSYPFLVEPEFSLQTQTLAWSSGYVVFVLVCAWCGCVLIKDLSARELTGAVSARPVKRTGLIDPLLWLAYAATGSILLLATTNKITQDIAVVPFLWVVPLALYLVTFIIAFDSPRWYNRYFWLPAFFVSLPLVTTLLAQDHADTGWSATYVIMTYTGAMFVACMVCHGEMTRIKPDPAHLTFFYLMVALGGAIGGIFVSLVAPLVFNGFWEFHLIWVLVTVLSGIAVFRHPGRARPAFLRWALVGVWGYAGVVLSMSLMENIDLHHENAMTERRNFYGVLRVYGYEPGSYDESRELYHGIINHGLQFMHPKRRSRPTSYYGRYSGIGFVMENPLRSADKAGNNPAQGLKVGVIGLGVGTLAAYARPGDNFRIYEINPEVESLAREYFTFLEDAAAPVDVILGDGRISLETELKENGPQGFDVLVLDAFSGDAIPAHLLTREAFELYWQHLKADGILAVHITNIYINLRPVVKELAGRFNKTVYYVSTEDKETSGERGSDWMLLTSNPEIMNSELRRRFSKLPERDPENILWTDDYSSIFPLLND
jgi:hypothetical protein